MKSSALIEKIIELAIEEDVATGDITTEFIISVNSSSFTKLDVAVAMPDILCKMLRAVRSAVRRAR